LIHSFARWRILIIFQLISGYCLAELSELKVYSPIVNKGDIGLEILGNTRFDDDENNDGFQFHELEFEYDVTNWWATSFTAGLIKEAGGSLIFDTLGWENTLQFTEQGKYWIDTGVHFELELDDENDKPNGFEIRWLLEKTTSSYQHTGNLNFEQQFGDEADESTELEYIWRSKKNITDHIAFGFEAYGAMGEIKNFSPMKDQHHIIGPAIYNELKIGSIEIETHLVWMFGLTDASPDNTFRWQIEFPFN
tara:strand:+ start:54 stop:803 length:750 start_codon:yes stop_codon:yes gene_type:complete